MLKRTNPTLKRRRLPENKYWNVLHLISMVWLGFLAVYEEISYHGVEQALLLIRNPAVKETAPRHFVRGCILSHGNFIAFFIDLLIFHHHSPYFGIL